MATSKTGSFYLSDRVALTAAAADGTRAMGEIDLGAYVNVPTGQAIAIDKVDFIWQNGNNFDGNVNAMVAANGSLTQQLTDLNPGTLFVSADDQSLIASGSVNIDKANNIASHSDDMYPDSFGGSANLDDSFMVVNDTLYLTVGNDGTAIGTASVYCTVKIRCRVVKLSQKNWMSIAIQSVASD